MSPIRLEGVLADRSAWQATDCSIDKAMAVVGTRSAMLLLREAYYGTTRFDNFAERVGITEAVASTRLRELTAAGLLEKRPYREPGQRTRHEYVLTQMGIDLLPAVLALMQWGDKYLQGDRGAPLTVVEDSTGTPVSVEVRGSEGPVTDLRKLRIRTDRTRRSRDR
ncbi:helix-turn-helix domain-containing protein [Antrihabitans sp. YC2-6]|uniref:winged helix-turn-helix transcriptional regulator n=1 Tax=Antrihabitans sp. YC2-6 TaxID=2799498 RepID=UPI0018F6F942|nr:helix-turn-helix domain-containing protein [Antrihabitans sp. YC2-6]MBJ8348529.1 helix-turn-helix transcriptional regulator [Antrihabitans sp. YC2-6]